jgi:hypothetical protein
MRPKFYRFPLHLPVAPGDFRLCLPHESFFIIIIIFLAFDEFPGRP